MRCVRCDGSIGGPFGPACACPPEPPVRASALAAHRAADEAGREIRAVASELRRVKREGLPYDGPQIEWQSGRLGATRPEPHIALGAEYVEDNDLDVDAEYVESLLWAVAHEAGYRERVLDEIIEALRP